MTNDEENWYCWTWRQNLCRLTNEFVEQTGNFFDHCVKVENDFSVTSKYLLSEKEKLQEQQYHLSRLLKGETLDSDGYGGEQSNPRKTEQNRAHDLEMTKLLSKIEKSEEREAHIQLLVDKFTVLAVEFERILKESEKPGFDASGKSEGSKSDEDSSVDGKENSERDDDLSQFFEGVTTDLESYIQYRRNREGQVFKKNYLHLDKGTGSLRNEALSQFLSVVEEEFVRLWKEEDQTQLIVRSRECQDVGTQTEDEQQQEKEREDQLWLFQEKLFISHQRDELGRMEKQLKSREEHLKRLEEEVQGKLRKLGNEKENWENEKKRDMSNSSVVTPPILSPPPDLKASSFDRCKRFPHVHPLEERRQEISNSAKSSGQSGFNRHHYYLSKMTDILQFYQQRKLQLWERIESNKFVSIITARDTRSINCSAEVENIIAIGYGATALDATEKTVQISHDSIQNSQDNIFKTQVFTSPVISQNNCRRAEVGGGDGFFVPS